MRRILPLHHAIWNAPVTTVPQPSPVVNSTGMGRHRPPIKLTFHGTVVVDGGRRLKPTGGRASPNSFVAAFAEACPRVGKALPSRSPRFLPTYLCVCALFVLLGLLLLLYTVPTHTHTHLTTSTPLGSLMSAAPLFLLTIRDPCLVALLARSSSRVKLNLRCKPRQSVEIVDMRAAFRSFHPLRIATACSFFRRFKPRAAEP